MVLNITSSGDESMWLFNNYSRQLHHGICGWKKLEKLSEPNLNAIIPFTVAN